MKLVFYQGLYISPEQQQRVEAAIAELTAVDDELLAEHGYELMIIRNQRDPEKPCFDIWASHGPLSRSRPSAHTTPLRQGSTEQWLEQDPDNPVAFPEGFE